MVASFEEWLWARHSHAITFWFALSVVSGVAISVKMPRHPSCWLQAFMSIITFLCFVFIHWRGKPYERAYIPMSVANVSVMLITLSLAKSEEEPGANLYFLASSWMDTISIICALVPTLLFGRFGKFWAVLAVLHTFPMLPYYKRMVGYSDLQALGRAIFIHAACYGVYYLYNTYELRAYSKHCSSSSSSSRSSGGSQREWTLKPPSGSNDAERTQRMNGSSKNAGGKTYCHEPAAEATTNGHAPQQQGPLPCEHAAAICCDAIANSSVGNALAAKKEGQHAEAVELMESLEHGRSPFNPVKYRSKLRTLQVTVKISGPISPDDFPRGAAEDLVSKINSSFPAARASQAAARWGCVLLALDILGPTDDLHQAHLESQMSDILQEWAAEHDLAGPLQLQVGNHLLQWGPRQGGQSNAEWELQEVVPLNTDGCSLELPPEALCLLPETAAPTPPPTTTIPAPTTPTTEAGGTHQQQQQGHAPPVRVHLRATVAVPSGSQLLAWQGAKNAEPEEHHMLLMARTQGCFLPVEIVQQQQQQQQQQDVPGEGACVGTQHELEVMVPLPHELLPRGETPELLWLELWQGNTALLASGLAILWPRTHQQTAAELAKALREASPEIRAQVHSFVADLATWLQETRLQDRRLQDNTLQGKTLQDETTLQGTAAWTDDSAHVFHSQSLRKQHSEQHTAKPDSRCQHAQQSAEVDVGGVARAHQQLQQHQHQHQHQHQQQKKPESVASGCELLHASILLGLPTVSGVVLRGLMAAPLSCSFADVASSCGMRLPVGGSAATALSSAGLLTLALRSHNMDMVLKVLEWGHAHAHPFSWEDPDPELGMSPAQLLAHLTPHNAMAAQLLPAVEGVPAIREQLSAVRVRSTYMHLQGVGEREGVQQGDLCAREGEREGAHAESGSEHVSVGSVKDGEGAASTSSGGGQGSAGGDTRKPNLWLCALMGFDGPGASPAGWPCEREYRDYVFKAVSGVLTPIASVCLLMVSSATLKVMCSQYTGEVLNWQCYCSIVDGLLLLGMLLGRSFHTRMAFLVVGRMCYLAQLFAMGMSWLPILPFARIMALARACIGVDALMYNIIYNMSTPFSMQQGFPWPLAFDFLASTAANALLFKAVGMHAPLLQSAACRCLSVLAVFCLDVRNRRAFLTAHEQRLSKKE